MLRKKEMADAAARRAAEEKQQQMFNMKHQVQQQMQDREGLRNEAQNEYLRERDQVDTIINKMI
jgi:predicted solute-binding protein